MEQRKSVREFIRSSETILEGLKNNERFTKDELACLRNYATRLYGALLVQENRNLPQANPRNVIRHGVSQTQPMSVGLPDEHTADDTE